MNETTINAAAILQDATEAGASDIFIVAGLPLSYRVNGVLFHKGERLMPDSTEAFIRQIYELTHTHPIDDFLKNGDDDFSFAIRGLSRFRVSTYKQRGSLAAVIRVITFELPNPAELGIPDAVMGLSECTKGMVLVTGPAGSGKSTTLACLVDRINSTKQDHIITLEDPLEYLHHHKESIVSQREISTDTENYLVALRAALRQSPDVILLGEMRDLRPSRLP